MKLFLLVTLFLSMAKASDCPEKLLKATTKNIQSYLKGYYKKVGKVKVSCSYEHDSNIFNLEHRLKAQATFKKRKLSFEVKTHSSMFNLFNFTDFDGKICHSKFGSEKKQKDEKLIKQNFLTKYSKEITDKDIKISERNGLICYSANIDKKKKLKKRRTLL